MEEQATIKLAQQGDTAALARLLQEHYPYVLRYLIKITFDPQWAEDLAQETMLKCIHKIKLYHDKSKFSSWLITIATRIHIDHLRKRQRERNWQDMERWEQDLHRGLEQLDAWVTPSVTDVHVWERLIVEERHIQRKKLRRELTIFWIVATVVWILGLLSFTQLPIAFVAAQVGALFGFPLFWAFKVRKRVTHP
ncbi:MAG: sigma-70 family RNA polymerase sigma factor [Paenibacillaceae bacterium]